MKCGNCKYFKRNIEPHWCLLQSVKKHKTADCECDVGADDYKDYDVKGLADPREKQ